MFGQFDDFPHEDTKGLFTFYRQQAQNEEEIRKIKKQRKLAKKRESQLKKRKEQEQIMNRQQKQERQIKQGQIKQEAERKIAEKERKSLHEPKNRRQKYHQHQLGSSVVVVNSKETERKLEPSRRGLEQKSSLKRIEQLINPHNNNRYFLQNKEMPISFGKLSLEKMVVKEEGEEKERSDKKSAVKPSYFNNYNSSQEERKYIPAFSYDRLPELLRSKPAHSEIILPKRYKSKKIETAMRSNNHELIRQIRESLRAESMLEKISYVDASQMMCSNGEQEYERRLYSQLDAKQRRLIEIIRNSWCGRKDKPS